MVDLSGTCLGAIVAERRRQIGEAQGRMPLETLKHAAQARSERRDFAAALSSGPLRVIAELKRASPSRGILRQQYRCEAIAHSYEAAGASALSVLTEERYFLGSLADLETVCAAVRLPVLRKDFILTDYQIYESVAAGADALLLIVAALSDEDLRRFLELCQRLRIAPLVEVHDESELERALRAGARIIGVNNRDLKTLEVDLEISFRLRPGIPAGRITVSESGMRTGEDLRRLAEAGYHAALIGERFMTAVDPGAALQEMLEGLRARS
ncbi:MAG TPA: indole-3-glycerol phosphate synthase TrpC [Terriglobia bacterium]|nr:indole-3-glycerol phosphate synthase TrpC [Terriglobia bacterium]